MKTCEGDEYVSYLDYGDCFTGVYIYIYISKLTKLYTLNICSLLYTVIRQGFPSGSPANSGDMCSIQVQKDSI